MLDPLLLDPEDLADLDVARETPLEYEVLTRADRDRQLTPRVRRLARRRRRNWAPILAELIRGRILFVRDVNVSESNVKYLTLHLLRRQKGEKLHVRHTLRKGAHGRMLWVDKEEAGDDAAVPD